MIKNRIQFTLVCASFVVFSLLATGAQAIPKAAEAPDGEVSTAADVARPKPAKSGAKKTQATKAKPAHQASASAKKAPQTTKGKTTKKTAQAVK